MQVSALEALRSIASAQRGSGDVESRERIVAAVRGKMASPDWLVRQAPPPHSPFIPRRGDDSVNRLASRVTL